MPIYKAPARDTRFIINEVLKLESYSNLPGFEGATPDIVDSVIDEAGRFASEVLAPLNPVGDAQGCKRNADGSVTTPPGFREAFGQYRDAGWATVSAPAQFGGQGLPQVLGFAVEAMMSSANQALLMYPGLANAVVQGLMATGSEEQKAKYLPKLIANQWLGTMNLTEPQCGTDLGLIRTRAEPRADGTYAVTGTKIFISAGENDLTENIIHLVLARTPDAPAGTKGISMFLVPKVLVNDDGSLGARNAVSCGAIERKMGIHGSPTCVMNYDGATGWLVGRENAGLAGMFVMMNAARLGVGVQGLALADVSYQNGVRYAGERRQGRALTGPAEPHEKADPLFVHPDIRRMLMDAKAFIEGLRGLALWAGLLVDLAEKAPTAQEREAAEDLLGLLTPVIKGYGSDRGFTTTVDMQQIWGGHGYIAENGMEQFVRDARITKIYEGANGVQAMDLVGRKLGAHGGRAIQAFFALVDSECATAKAEPRLAEVAVRVEKSLSELKAATLWLAQNGRANPVDAGAGATEFMHITGIVALGLSWLRIARTALDALDRGTSETAFYEAKLVTARHFAERFAPDAGALRRRIEAGGEAIMALPPEAFEIA